MTFASDWVAFHADRTPDKLAMLDQGTGTQFTYAEFNDRCGRLAAFMRDEWNIGPGDRVAILAKNSVEFFTFQFACVKLGAMMLPLNWRLAVPELLFILNDATPRALLYDNDFAESIPRLLAESPIEYVLRLDLGAQPADDHPEYEAALASTHKTVAMHPGTSHETAMTIMYTAGTTGHPKGVLITHGMTFWNMINISTPAGINVHSTNYTVLPTFHTGGLNLYANPVVHMGGTNIIARAFDPGEALRTLSANDPQVTHFLGVPAVYLFMSQHDDFDTSDLSGVESWGCGGAPLPVPVLKRFAELGILIQPGFGMTETSPTVFLMAKRRVLDKPTSVGRPMPHTRVRIIDEAGDDVPQGDVGEVAIGGPNITPGYWQRPDANARDFFTDEHGVRWIRSGDAGKMDDDGCVYIVDRYKDMYISGGENVYPAEVEKVIEQLDAVLEVGVIGVPDDTWGEVGKAIIATKKGQCITPEAVIAHCQANLAKYKVPKSVGFIDALPRNAAGKVLKRELRQQFSPESEG